MRKTRLVNTYDNRIGSETCYKGNHDRSKRAIEDIRWKPILRGRVILLRDFNAHSSAWDPLISLYIEAGSLEQIIEDYNLILNNEPKAITKLGKIKSSIINLTFTTLDIGPLKSWAVERDNPTPSDHEFIVLKWADLNKTPVTNTKEITGWDINRFNQDSEALKKAKEYWHHLALNRLRINYNNSENHFNNEATWIEDTLTKILNQYTKTLQIIPYSKRWWTAAVKKARTQYANVKKK
jgi:hypothetical protein